MKKKYILSLIAIATFSWGHSQQNIWTISSEREVSKTEKMDRVALPIEYHVFNIDLDNLKNLLKKAPNYKDLKASPLIIPFPDSDGEQIYYEIYDAPVMEKDLSAKYPNIKSYLGKAVKDSNTNIRFSVTPFGLFAMIYHPEKGTMYIDTYTKDLKNYIVYNRENLIQESNRVCLTDQNQEESINETDKPSLKNNLFNNHGVYREYRLAMACTIEYSRFHINAAQRMGIPTSSEQQKKEVVLSAIVTTMTRVNFIFERDNAVHMNLVDNNDSLIFINSDNFSNDDSNRLIMESQRVITNIIGNENFDIGHTVSTGAGGLARVEVPCNTNYKAMGVTGSPSPIGDPFDVDFVGHEMGHQFGANHTFNSSCMSNRSNLTAVEPGSGNSIMGYAGVCPQSFGEGPINVKRQGDPFFHSISIEQISNFISNEGNCSNNTPSNNPAPIANAGPNWVIPKGTPFFLEGTATDINNQNQLTYTWEQMNKEISTQPPVATSTNGPNFYYIVPKTTPKRYFPNYNDVLSGINRRWEVLPTVQRVLKFRFFVRDNNTLLGGQTAYDDMEVAVSDAGPFTITYPSSGNERWEAGSTQTVRWNVAGTTANGVNTSHVNIKISDDDGQNFTTLVENTPNDGNESIVVPGFATNRARILIEPVNNVYYSVSKKFNIAGGTASINDNIPNEFKLYPNPTQDTFVVELNTNNTNEILIELHDLRGRLINKEIYKNVSSTFRHEQNIAHLQAGIYFVTVKDGQNKMVKKLVKQ